MLLKNSNLYAERIYAEHPLGLWPLDDDISFLQLFSDNQQDLLNGSLWGYTNLNTENPELYDFIPITSSPQSRFSLSSSPSLLTEIASVFSVSSSSSFSSDKETACFSAHVYQESIFISYFEIGISYDGQEYKTEHSFGSEIGWKKLSHTFNIPENKNISFFIKVKFSEASFATEADYKFQINGVSLGQWSEQYNSTSRGFNDLSVPNEISHIINASSSYTCLVADSYGLNDSYNGYYLLKDKEIYARNSGIPLVYGSKNSTKILEAEDNNPSIILPGIGFLNESGKYNSYTLEAWIRLDNLSASPVKIIGPVFSDDGLYVEEGFISIRVGGKYIKSYFVGKWYRPMLVHFKYSEEYVYLYINGEEVISQAIEIDKVSLAENEVNGSSQDWIGVYGNDLINPFEIDCISIIPYSLPLEMAKRRFVYGQGVEDVEVSTSVFSSRKILFDYSNSVYASNIIYPDMNRWKDAFSTNLNTNSSFLSAPNYELPFFQSNNSLITYDIWKEANKEENINYPDNFKYFKIKPSTEIDPESYKTSLFFNNINVIDDRLRSVFGVFKSDLSVETQQPIFVFGSNSSVESLRVVLDPDLIKIDGGNSSTEVFDDQIDYGQFDEISFSGTDDFGSSAITEDNDGFILKYIYKSYTGQETTIYQELIDKSEYFVAGIDIREIQTRYNSIIGNFFSSTENISFTVGQYESYEFLGNIYGVHFNNDFFFEKDIAQYFENGTMIQEESSNQVSLELLDYTANYSLIPLADQNIFNLDVGVSGYWEDIQPLSYFGKYIDMSDGSKKYDLDMIQFNIDSPNSYENNSSVKSYITLKDFSNANTKQYSDYNNIEELGDNKVIDFNYQTYNNTKYEVANKTIVMTPRENFERYYLGIHLEIKVRGINQKSFILRRVELSSMSFNDSSPTKIGSRNSEFIYPFSREKYLFNYKEKNPITIYKDSSPYLYLTDDSGIHVNEYDTSYTRGVFIPINKNKVNEYNLGSFQAWIRYQENIFDDGIKKIMSVKIPESSIEFYLFPEIDGKRATVKSYDYRTGKELKNVVYFQDGKKIDYPVIYPKRWTAIAMSFLDTLNFSNYTGRIELYDKILFNNITTYTYSTSISNISKTVFGKWFQVISSELESGVNNSWDTWSRPEGQINRNTWKDSSSTTQENQFTINGEQIYNSQIGLSVSVTDDTSRLSLYSNGADVLTEVIWKTIEKSPV